MARNLCFYINFDRSFTGGPRVVYNFVKKIDKTRYIPIVLTNKTSELTERLSAVGCECIIIPQHSQIGDRDGEAIQGGFLRRLSAVGQTLGYNRKIRAILKQRHCDLLWVRNVKGVLLTGVAARQCGVPLVWDIGMEKNSAGIIRHLHNAGFRFAAKVVTEAGCVAASIFTPFQRQANAKKLEVVKSGIPDDRVAEIQAAQSRAVAKRLSQDTNARIRIINIATVCDRKNQSMIVKATLPLIKEFPNLLVSFVGPPVEQEYMNALQSQIALSGSDPNYEFVGWRDDAVELLVCSDIFVLSSKIEGVPYSVLESMHAGVPVVATRCGGVPDVILNGETGFTMEIDDVESMRAAVRRLITDRQIRQTIVANAKQFVLQNHTSEKWCSDYMNLFDRIIAEHGKSESWN